MAKRSTRNKIKWQGRKAVETLSYCLQHLQYMQELADGRSEYINENLPLVLSAFDSFKDVLQAFRQGL